MKVKKMKSEGRAVVILVLLAVTVGDAHMNEPVYAPGVPPKKDDYMGAGEREAYQKNLNQDDSIKFHEPSGYNGGGDPNPSNDSPNPRIHKPHRNMAHRFGGSGSGGKLDIQHEKEHMKSHGHGQVEAWVDLDSMDEPKLMATYFRNFDLDKNGRIDGLELLKSMQKMNDEHKHDEDETIEMDDLVGEVDEEMRFYDTNNDGYIMYGEFMTNHKRRIAELRDDDDED